MDLLNVHTALRFACSQDPNELKVGEEQLKAWQKDKGYYAGLATVFGDHSVDSTVRWMAITCLKNGVDTYWRPTAPNAIDPEEKSLIRKVLLESIEEPEQKISLQLAVLIAKIGRMDCPHEWPELLPVLTEKVRSESPLVQRCGLLTLKEVTKAFSSWRLSEQRLIFFEVTSSIFSYTTNVWFTHLTSVSGYITQGKLDNATSSLTLATTCLKILQLMLLHGFARFNADSDAVQLVGYLFELAPQALELRSQLPQDHSSFEAAEETTTMIIKTLFKLQRNHPIGYIAFLDQTLELIYMTIFNLEKRVLLYEKYTVYGLNMLKCILKCEDYAIPSARGTGEVFVPVQVLQAQKSLSDFFNDERLRMILEQIVTNFMLLTSEDIEMWNESPEEYFANNYDEGLGQSYALSLKGSVEGALMAVLHTMPSAGAPIITRMIEAVQNTDNSAEWSALLMKEAVYNAVGLVAFDLYQYMDFELWFQTHLIKDLSVSDKRYHIIKRRVLWLLGCWVGVKFDAVYHPTLYQCIINNLGPNENVLVRLAAVDTLKQSIEDISFSSEPISTFIPSITECLLVLLRQLESPETKLLVMNTFCVLIERVGTDIQPYVGSLLELIPHMWVETQGDNSSLLRSVIITTLSHTVCSLGHFSSQLHPFLIHVINGATDTKQPEHLFLAEDGLQLWKSVLHHAPQPTLELASLIQNMSGLLGLASPSDDSTRSLEGLMDIGSSNLLVCFYIIKAYVILFSQSPDIFMQYCSEVTVKACQTYIRDVKQSGVDAIVDVLDFVMVAYPTNSHQLLEPVLLQLLHCVLSGEETYAPTLCLYLAVLARAMLCNPQHFLILLQSLVQQLQQEANVLLGTLLDIWAYRTILEKSKEESYLV
ncbi:PREDICTED: importin-11-like isoform X2 [Amphimedon queenslandica]|uniref:Importin N-terminal domain-containing protein n=1 Tax=Amphimedon queenslandica TaxID=400682 RepID=A0AAN0J7R5_AMPQE|nr:PREDICTED: importin-11-like isoform X2 [Amphimedon queenslandica]|eukprot:XP_019852787.1 PREDICTED: importin-11-like isoform X2 [Amphimedon queenslandica]